MKVKQVETKMYTYTLEGLTSDELSAIKSGLQMLGAGFPRSSERIRSNTKQVVRLAGQTLLTKLDEELEDEEG